MTSIVVWSHFVCDVARLNFAVSDVVLRRVCVVNLDFNTTLAHDTSEMSEITHPENLLGQ
jgi:hypothetical protein